MMAAIHIAVGSYADFNTVISALPDKIAMVFYNPSGGNPVQTFAAVTEDRGFIVTGGIQTGETPAITTDFPNAVALSDNTTVGNTFNQN